MEFIKLGKNYLIKGSNGRIVSEKEKLELENKELVIKDIKGCDCQQETTKKIKKNKKRIKELEKVATELYKKETAQTEKEVDADDTIEETDKSI